MYRGRNVDIFRIRIVSISSKYFCKYLCSDGV